MRLRYSLAVFVGLLAVARPAAADTIVSGSGELALFEQRSATPTLTAGGAVQLAVLASIPAYTSAPRGYLWDSGLGIDLTLRRGVSDAGSFAAGQVGVRYDITFSQRRMGLARVSGKGGFYLAARSGVIRSRELVEGPAVAAELVPASGDSPQAIDDGGTRLIASAGVGTYVRFLDRARLITELGVFRVGGLGASATSGINFQVGLGLDL